MCGIFFTTYPDSSYNYNLFKQLQHRGPDVSIFRTNNKGSVGFHRLSIIDPNATIVQPFYYKHTVVLCNGEIYNWKRLYEKYNLQHNTILPTDCGVVPLLYEYFDGDFTRTVQELEGEFAIVLFDTLQNKIYATRDFMGIRPLYYTIQDEYVWIASEIKSLPLWSKCHHIIPRKVYCFDLDEEIIHRQSYWEFPNVWTKSVNDVNKICIDIYSLLIESVFSRLQTDQPIGCLLSGGIDSSMIAAIASQFIPNIRCFTIGVPGSPDVEAAKKVAEYLNIDLTIVEFSIDEGIASIIPVIYHLETYDITTIRASIPQYLLAKWIRKYTDIKVLLSGEGSDELFSGYVYSRMAPDSVELYNDGIRLLDNLYQYDCLRTDRVLSAWGIEVRVPFLNKSLVDYVLHLNPEIRMCSKTLEKELLRKIIEKYKLLPASIARRPKAAFSDAVSCSGVSWYQSIQKWIEPYDFENSQTTTHNPPISQESKYYREVFDVLFPNQSHLLPEYWLPRWSKTTDPSATTLECYDS